MTAEQQSWWFCWCHHTKFIATNGVVSRGWIGVSEPFTNESFCIDMAQEKASSLGSSYLVLWPIAAASAEKAVDKFIEHFRDRYT